MRITKENLRMYWKNFDRVCNGRWTPSFAIAFIFGFLMFIFLMFFLLFIVLYLMLEHTVIFLPLLLVFTIVRLGYAAAKGKENEMNQTHEQLVKLRSLLQPQDEFMCITADISK